MPDDNKQNNRDRKTSEVKVPPRNWLVWTLILVAIPVVIFLRTKTQANYQYVSRQQLQRMLKDETKMQGKIYYPPPQSSQLAEIAGIYASTINGEINFRAKLKLTDDLE